MLGPFPVVGDCIAESERLAVAYIECEPIRAGDLGIWFMPSREAGEQYAAKILVDCGGWWLACKYFAVRYREGFHIPVGRVVGMIPGEPGSFDPELSARMTEQILELRANPPARADLVVFPMDILDLDEIVAAIDQHRRQWS
jgi:hypothetical protein